jgi:hypothetical protein
VRVREGEVHLRHQDVGIISRVANDCSPLSVAENIAIALAKQKLGGISALEQERMADRAIAIQALKVQPWRSGILEFTGVDAVAYRRSIRRDVVGDELAKERPPCGVPTERRFVINI